MISLIQERKLSHLFQILDASKNKSLTPEDFTIVSDSMCDILGYPQGSRSRLELQVKSFRLFVQLLADLENEEACISHEEWMRMFRYALAKKPQMIKNYVYRIANYIFTLFDQDSDEVVSEKEYMDMFLVYGISEEFVKEAFRKLDENNDGVLSKAEVINAFNDFFFSSDRNAQGNWIFGNWELSKI